MSPSSGTIIVTLTVTPPHVADGDALTVAAQAVPSGNVTVRLVVIRSTGALTITDSVTLHGAGPQSVTRHYAVPLQTPPGRGTSRRARTTAASSSVRRRPSSYC